MCFEMFAILLALSIFFDVLRGKAVMFHVDNQGALGIMRSGVVSAADHHMFSFALGAWVGDASIVVWLERVPSKYNVADEPTRGEFEIYDLFGVRVVSPVVGPVVRFLLDEVCRSEQNASNWFRACVLHV